jgi:pyruvate-formate lyase-activating enzyme
MDDRVIPSTLQALLAPLRVGSPLGVGWTLQAMEGDRATLAGHRRIFLDVRPHVPGRRRIAATRSYAIAWSSDVPGPLAETEKLAIALLVRQIRANDVGLPPARTPPARPDVLHVGPHEAWLVIRSTCEMHCLFCSRGRGGHLAHERRTDEIDYPELLRTTPRGGCETLCLGGDEPLAHPDLRGIIDAAKHAGYRAIEVRTSGQRLGQPGVAAALVGRGVTAFDLPLYGVTAEVHDAVTGLPGSHAGVWRAIAAVEALGVTLRLHSVIVRANLDQAPRLHDLALSRFGRALPFGHVAPRADAADYAGVAPTMSEVRRVVGNTGMELWGFPTCIARHADPHRSEGLDRPPAGLVRGLDVREKPPACRDCRWLAACPGIFTVHARAYGDEGLVPP